MTDHLEMKTPPIVSPQEWEAARLQLLVKEKELTRARDALAAERRRMPVDGRREGLPLRGPGRPGEPARPVRAAPAADRLPLLLRAGRDHLRGGGRGVPGAGLRRLLDDHRPGRPPRPPERARHHARQRLARPPGRDPGLEGAHGMGAHPLVHDRRRLRQRLRGRRVARAQRLHPRGRPDLPHLFRQ
jgi:hypothetical protein